MESIAKTNAEFRLDTYGSWYYAIPSGEPSDEEWFQKQDWIDALGIARIYGTIDFVSGQAGFGTIDQNLIDIGRLKLDAGRFPEQDYEIAMEQDVLNGLGYTSDLNQDISLDILIPCGTSVIPIQRTYRLCGILHEYTDLWLLNENKNQQLLVSAYVTTAEGENILDTVRESLEDITQKELIDSNPEYFLNVTSSNRNDAQILLNDYLASSRNPYDKDVFACINTVAFPKLQATEHNTFYIYMIALITFFAVLCTSIMEISEEVQRYTILRSIGITKLQLLILLLTETSLTAFPAIVLGIPLGIGATWLALRGLLYTGSVPIQITIPYVALGRVLLLWFVSVIISRIILFIVSLRTPLIGRMQLSRSRDRIFTHLREALILALIGIFTCITLITALESFQPSYQRKYWGLCPTYTLWKDKLILKNEIDLIRQIPGIARLNGFGEMEIKLSYPGLEEQVVLIYSIDANDWKESLDFGDSIKQFQHGQQIILGIPEDIATNCVLPENTVHLKIDGKGNSPLTEIDIVANPTIIKSNSFNRGLYGFDEPYTIFCSEELVQNLLDSMESGKTWDKFVAGESYGYDRVYAYANLNSDNLSTDMTIANFCNAHNIKLDNRRQEFQALVQENSQTLIMLSSAWCCIALIILILLISALALEAEHQKTHFGILRTIGLSINQMRLQILLQALIRSVAGFLIGWSIYGIYIVSRDLNTNGILSTIRFKIEELIYWGCDTFQIVITSMFCLSIPLIIQLLSKRSLTKGGLVL